MLIKNITNFTAFFLHGNGWLNTFFPQFINIPKLQNFFEVSFSYYYPFCFFKHIHHPLKNKKNHHLAKRLSNFFSEFFLKLTTFRDGMFVSGTLVQTNEQILITVLENALFTYRLAWPGNLRWKTKASFLHSAIGSIWLFRGFNDT